MQPQIIGNVDKYTRMVEIDNYATEQKSL